MEWIIKSHRIKLCHLVNWKITKRCHLVTFPDLSWNIQLTECLNFILCLPMSEKLTKCWWKNITQLYSISWTFVLYSTLTDTVYLGKEVHTSVVEIRDEGLFGNKRKYRGTGNQYIWVIEMIECENEHFQYIDNKIRGTLLS